MSQPHSILAPLPALLRDLATGFRQQMFFWGQDVTHPDGNLFLRSGFEKRPSEGLQGTSCYARPWQDGRIELHGSQAGWLGPEGGFLFVRPFGRCVRWLAAEPPVPGKWPRHLYDVRADDRLADLANPFFEWWLEHERQVARFAGAAFREACFRQFRKLPRTRAWLPPADAVRWITALRNDPATTPRVRNFPTLP